MSAPDYIFWVFAIVTVLSAAVVVLARSLIYSAFALLFTFFGVAGLYVLLGADFLAATQMLVYIGGILVLLLFGVMLTHKIYDLDLRTEKTQLAPGLIVGVGLFVILSSVAVRTEWPSVERAPAVTTEALGRSDQAIPHASVGAPDGHVALAIRTGSRGRAHGPGNAAATRSTRIPAATPRSTGAECVERAPGWSAAPTGSER